MKTISLVLSLCMLTASLHAANRSWSGGGGNNFWSTAGNWSPVGQPQPGDLIFFNFDEAPITSTNDLTDLRLDSLYITSPQTIWGHGIVISNALRATLFSASTIVVHCRITLGQNAMINLSSGYVAGLHLDGGVDLGAYDLSLDVSAYDNVEIWGAISGTGNLTKTGAGSLQLGGVQNNTLTGTVRNEMGDLYLHKLFGAVAIRERLEIGAAGTVVWENTNQVYSLTDVRIEAGGRMLLNGNEAGFGNLEMWGGLIDTGGGNLVLHSSSSLTVRATNETAVIAGRVVLGAASRVLDVAGPYSPALDIIAKISGVPTGGFIKNGGGLLWLRGANTFNGGVLVNDGVVEARNASAFGGTSGGTTLSGGSIILRGVAVGDESLTVSGTEFQFTGVYGSLLSAYDNSSWAGPIILNTNLVVFSGDTTILSGLISGPGGLDTFYDTVRLSGSSGNSYAGATRVMAGTLELQKSTGDAIVGPLEIGDAAGGISADIVRLLTGTVIGRGPIIVRRSGLLDLNGYSDDIGELTLSGGSVVTGTGTLTLGGNLTSLGSSRTATIDGNLNLGGVTRTFHVDDGSSTPDLSIAAIVSNGGFNKMGGGTLFLSGANTYTGATTINDGIIEVDSVSGLGSSLVGTTVNDGGTLAYRGNVGSVPEHLTLNGAGFGGSNGAVNVMGTVTNFGSITLATSSTIRTEAAAQFFIPSVIGGTGDLTKTGAGTLTLNGVNANTYLGETFISGGLVQLSKGGAVAIPGPVTVGSGQAGVPGATLRYLAGSSFAVFGGFTVNEGSLLDLNDQSESFSLLGVPLRLNGGGDVRTGSGLLTLPAGTTVVVEPGVNGHSSISGRLGLQTSLGTGNDHTFFVNSPFAPGGLAQFSLSADLEAVSGTAHVIKTGSGEMNLAGNYSTYTGQLVVNGGRVTLDSNGALGAPGGGVIVNSNAVLAIEGPSTLNNEPLTLNSTAPSPLVILSFDSVWNGTIALDRKSAVTVDPGVSLLVRGAITGGSLLTKLGPGDLILGGNSFNTETQTRVHEGTLVLSNSHPSGAVTGDLTIGDGVGGAGADVVRLKRGGQIENSVRVTLASSGLLDLNGFSESFGSLAGGGQVIPGGAVALEVGLDDTSTSYSGIVSGGVNFWKHGLGTMILSGNNSYTGTTLIAGGTLLVNGSQPQSPVVISNGCTLGGSGIVGSITVAAGGTVSPGTSAGILSGGGVTFHPGSVFRVELNGTTAGTGYDQLSVRSGALQLGGATLNATLGFQSGSNSTFAIINNAGAGPISGTFDGLPQNATLTIGGIQFRISYTGGTGNDVVLTQLQSPPTPPTLIINLMVSNIVHHFTPAVTVPAPEPGYVTDELIYDKAGLTNVNLADYGAFELRLFAPDGQRITVSPPTNNYISELSIAFGAGLDSQAHTEPATLVFENFSGAMPSRSYGFFGVANAGNVLRFSASEDYTDPIEFSALKYRFVPDSNPANTPKTFVSGSGSEAPVVFSYVTSQTNDPGPFVTMGALVQPAIALTYGADGIALTWRSRLGAHYQPQSTTNLLLGESGWSNLGPEIVGNGFAQSFAGVSLLGPARFYRLRILP